MSSRDSETARRCAYPGCEKLGDIETGEIPGGLLRACPDHIDLALFIMKIHDEADFHIHAD